MSQRNAKGFTIKQETDDKTTSQHFPHVLLVEDNTIALRLLETLLKQAGCEFTSTMNAENGFDLIKKSKFDLIITDIGLPGMSGIELAIYIRDWEKDNNQKATPIVGLTAHCLASSAYECIEAGMSQVFTKPMTPTILTGILSELVTTTKENQHSNVIETKDKFSKEIFLALEQFSLLDSNQGINNLGSIELLRESLELMMSELPLEKIKIQQAYEASAWESLGDTILRMRSSAIYCGTARLQYACQYLQINQKAGDTTNFNTLYHHLLEVIETTQQSIKDWLNQQK
ncbi:response regulator [Legionella feeleii]|uniref:Sensory box histidine kinase/response regulator n=1 Tax=Legionella feeleii TaxID=453 RepID=A0A378ITL7_9GAMM|nr:response regulator [Legionella feeleii]STX37841.1 sensory box histidine kinase/response regulator [Legionella feeleii]